MRVQAALDADPVLRELSRAPREVESAETETTAYAGAGYPLGVGTVYPATRRAFVALAAIESPLLGRVEDLADWDAFRALYAVCAPEAALVPVAGRASRRQALARYQGRAEQSPDLYAAWLRAGDVIEAETWQAFDTAAAHHAAQFGPVSPAEVVELLYRVLADATSGLRLLPENKGAGGDKEDDGDAKKKRSALSGPQTSTLYVRANWAYRLAKRLIYRYVRSGT
jgi:hypothetical protein